MCARKMQNALKELFQNRTSKWSLLLLAGAGAAAIAATTPAQARADGFAVAIGFNFGTPVFVAPPPVVYTPPVVVAPSQPVYAPPSETRAPATKEQMHRPAMPVPIKHHRGRLALLDAMLRGCDCVLKPETGPAEFQPTRPLLGQAPRGYLAVRVKPPHRRPKPRWPPSVCCGPPRSNCAA